MNFSCSFKFSSTCATSLVVSSRSSSSAYCNFVISCINLSLFSFSTFLTSANYLSYLFVNTSIFACTWRIISCSLKMRSTYSRETPSFPDECLLFDLSFPSFLELDLSLVLELIFFLLASLPSGPSALPTDGKYFELLLVIKDFFFFSSFLLGESFLTGESFLLGESFDSFI